MKKLKEICNKLIFWILSVFKRPIKNSSFKKIFKHNADVVEGGFKNLKSLLNGLDDTFYKMKRMSSNNFPQALKRHGVFIFSLDWENDYEAIEACDSSIAKLPGFEVYGLPSILFCNLPWKDRNDPQSKDKYEFFSWAIKSEKVPHIRRKPNFIYYEYGLYFPKSSYSNIPEFSYSTFVGVNKYSGEIIPVPTFYSKRNEIKINGGYPKQFYQQTLEYVCISDQEILDVKARKKHIVERFSMLYSMVMRREMGTNIVVTKNGAKATFIVPENQWKRFFKERIDLETAGGRKTPIFHAVMSHERNLKGGFKSSVKTHYRGSRRFSWNGYEVSIVMPGKHGVAQAEFGLETPSDERASKVKCIQMKDVDLSGIFGHHA